MTVERYLELKQQIIDAGYREDIEWQQTVQAPDCAELFAIETIFVICNSGMQAQVARKVFGRVCEALLDGNPVESVFHYKLKARAIEGIWKNRHSWFDRYVNAPTQEAALDVLASMDHIGPITKYHLAKNFGLDVVKPDRHLQRLAAAENTTPHDLCRVLAEATGDRISTVDYILWRCCNLGILRANLPKTDVLIKT